MTDFAELLRADQGQDARALHIVDKAGLEAWLAARPERARAAVAAGAFAGDAGQVTILPGDRPDDWEAAAGVADAGRLTPWCLARAAELLVPGDYRPVDRDAGAAALGWLLAQHRFTRYRVKADTRGPRVLLSREVSAIGDVLAEAEATALVRDMVDTPARDMGPADIDAIVRDRAAAWRGEVTVTSGAALADGYPMIHAVGEAAAAGREPRLIELEWGDPAHPRVAIVGKGVCFDTGGLDIKPASGMRLMKKDMGGAAHAIALAGLVVAARLPVRLHLLVPAVENAIDGAALRPGDVLRARKGVHVEIHNTDAEGRLVLADALTRALEEEPALILDFATLTGAARVALGPDLPALFANDDALAADLADAAAAVCDPLWRLPLWHGYDDLYASDVADFANASDSPFAGAITAALFLDRFVPRATPWAHVDTFAWRPAARPGRPKGGEALSLRAAFAMLRRRFAAS